MSRLSYSNFFVWEQRQRSGSRFWMRRVTKEEKDRERQTRKDTMKPSAPQKLLWRQRLKQKQAQRDTVMNARGTFRKMTHFYHLQRERLLIKATYNTALEHESLFSLFCSSCNCTENHTAHKSCGHFFISTTCAPLPYAFKSETICFSRGPWKIALMPSKRKEKKKRKENRHISLKLPPFGR